MKIPVTQATFVGGEWSPSLYARNDLGKHSTSVRKMKNMIVSPHGPVSNRGGLEFVYEVKDSSKKSILIQFQFSVLQAYILEFGHNYMRVIKDGGLVLDSQTSQIYEIATPYTEDDLVDLKFSQSADVMYITHTGYPPKKLSRTGHDSWTITDISFGADVEAPGQPTSSGTKFSYIVTTIDADGRESVGSPSVVSDPGNIINWTAVTGAEYYNVYKDTNNSGVFGWIGQANNNSFKEPIETITPDFEKTPPKASNPFDGPGNYPAVSTFFESRLLFAGTINEPQTIFGSVIGDFENMNKSSPLREDDAYKHTINAGQVNAIRFMVPLNELLLGTSGAEWKMRAGSQGDTITPTSVDVKIQSQWGVSKLRPMVIGDTVLLVEGSGNVVRDLKYSLEADGYRGNDLSVLSTHLLKNYSITDWTYQQDPDSVIWCVRSDGKLLGLTYYKEHEVFGWHRHETDGEFEAVSSLKLPNGKTEVYVIVKRIINGQIKRYIERFRDRLPVNSINQLDVKNSFFVDSGLSLDIPKSITGISQAAQAIVTCEAHGYSNGDIVELSELVGMDDLQDKKFTVSAVTANTFTINYDTTSSTPYVEKGVARKAYSNISGLGHLEGKRVAILADGNVVNGKVVTGGQVSLDQPASRIHIGLPYESELVTMDFEAQTQEGTTIGLDRSIKETIIRLKDTRAIYIGPDNEDKLTEVKFREDEAYGTPTKLFTGNKEIELIEAGDNEERVMIKVIDPLPMTLLALTAKVEYGKI